MIACPCGSFAINPNRHGREPGVDTHLCDVCYWRERADVWKNPLAEADARRFVWLTNRLQDTALDTAEPTAHIDDDNPHVWITTADGAREINWPHVWRLAIIDASIRKLNDELSKAKP